MIFSGHVSYMFGPVSEIGLLKLQDLIGSLTPNAGVFTVTVTLQVFMKNL